MTETEGRAAVVAAAMSWVGTPWRHAARAKGAGVDCGHLLIAAYEEAGLVAGVDPGSYPRDWALHRSEERFLAIVEQYAKRRPDGVKPQPADVVLFRYGRCLSHGGIVVKWPKIVHAHLSVGMVIVDDVSANDELQRRLVGAWNHWEA